MIYVENVQLIKCKLIAKWNFGLSEESCFMKLIKIDVKKLGDLVLITEDWEGFEQVITEEKKSTKIR